MADKILKSFEVWIAGQGVKSRTRLRSVDNISLEGIARLRELILDLAVRGKLVKQDSKDEPASTLLTRISQEKKRLVQQGKLKEEKPIRKIAKEHYPFELPSGWEFESIGNYVYLEMGQSPSSEFYNQTGDGLPFFQGKADFGSLYPTPRYWCTNPQKYSYPGDVLLSVRAPVGPTNIANIVCCIGRGLAALRPLAETNSSFLNILMKVAEGELAKKGTGTTFSAVSKDDIRSIVLSIPPLAEQHRIVAKVEELMALCDELEKQETHHLKSHALLVETLLGTLTQAKDPREFQQAWSLLSKHFDDLFTTEDSIDQLKQTILQLAVMGKLVPQDPKDLPAPAEGKFFVYVLECSDGSWYKGFTTDIVKRWKEHAAGKGAEHTKKFPPVRLMHWEEFDSEAAAVKREQYLKSGEGRAWLKQNEKLGRLRQAGEPASVLLDRIRNEKERLVKEGKLGKQSILTKITEREKLRELPSGWEYTRFGEVVFNRDAERIPLSVDERSTRKGEYDYYGASGVIDNIDEYLFDKPLLLIGEDGANLINRTTPIAFMARGKYWVNNHAHVIDGICEELLLFVCLHINAISLEPYVTGTAQPKMNQAKMNSIVLTLPPLSEQVRIVSKVNELFALCDGLKARLAAAQTLANQMAEGVVG